MAAQNGTPRDQAFFSEEATRQILHRVANVFSDPDLCDATFIVGEGAEKEEINAPSQFMAVSSSYFKNLFYPPGEDKRREIPLLQPKTFRKILDYLFRGRVPMSSIEDAWKLKVAGRTFELNELEELCTKFLKYRIDSKNLVHFLKNTTKYDTPDLREVVIGRFVKDASSGFAEEQVLELSEEELSSIMERKPEIQAKMVMEVLIRWARKYYNIPLVTEEESPKVEPIKESHPETKVVEKADTKDEKAPEKGEGENAEVGKKEEDATKETNKEVDATKEDSEKKEEDTGDAGRKEDTKKTEVEEKQQTEAMIQKAPKAAKEENFIEPLKGLVKFVTWDHSDADYYLKEIHTKKILTEDTKNSAMAQMLQAYVNLPTAVAKPSPATVKMGPKSAQQRAAPEQRNQRGGQKRAADVPAGGRAGDCQVLMEKISKNPRAAASTRVKTEDEML